MDFRSDSSSFSDFALRQARVAELSINGRLSDALTRRGWEPCIKPYTGYGSAGWARVMCRVLVGRPEDRRKAVSLTRGWRNFVSIPMGNVRVKITLGGHTTTVATDDNGLIDTVVKADLPVGWHEAVLMADDAEPARAQIRVIGAQPQVALISDIDDTVLVTSLPRPMLAAWNTFVLNEQARRPVPGMAVLYERLVRHYQDPPVFYLSTGAWNVAATLTRFLSRNLYPAGPLLLTDWGPTEDRWFRSGQEHKRRSLARLVQELPQLKWLLIGDDGQHDPTLYAEFVRDYREHVAAVAIRQLSPTEQVLASGYPLGRFSDAHPGDLPWVSAPHGAGLARSLKAAGLLG